MTVTTVYFDGQFWVALIERIAEDGSIRLGRHVFGSEPSNPELLSFMTERFLSVPDFPSPRRARLVRTRSSAEEERQTGKARSEFHRLREAELQERKRERRVLRLKDREAAYERSRERRKMRKRGK